MPASGVGTPPAGGAYITASGVRTPPAGGVYITAGVYVLHRQAVYILRQACTYSAGREKAKGIGKRQNAKGEGKRQREKAKGIGRRQKA